MSPSLLKPVYRSKTIASRAALARAVGLSELQLTQLAARASLLYRPAKQIVKPDGSIRQPYDAKQPLKRALERLKLDLFEHVEFPKYLTGSIKKRDYKLNASLHVGKGLLICEDIKRFFPSVKDPYVYDVYAHFFGFPPVAAELLTLLTTKDGCLPEGACTSSYLANLVLFRWEPSLEARLAHEGVTYSRYVDDIALSTNRKLTLEEQWGYSRLVYAMLAKIGLKPKRQKHEVFTASVPMIATKLVVNKKPSLPKQQRSAARAAVFQVEQLASVGGLSTPDSAKLVSKVSAKLGLLGRFHPTKAKQLKSRLAAQRTAQYANGVVTGDGAGSGDPAADCDPPF